MENDSQAIAVGLGAGLGGFACFVIVTCILWHICCGSWCEKRNSSSTSVLSPQTTQHRNDLSNRIRSNTTTTTDIHIKNTSFD